jgi:hypothetical protein
MRSIIKMARKIVSFILKAESWKLKRTWIGALFILRMAYVAMNEYGKNPFKKALKGDHVFLTGAGSGIGRMMAIKFGKMGCKLSLSDVNMSGLRETKEECVKAGISPDNVNIFFCDVSKRTSIAEGAESARAAFGTVTLLVNNAGVVSGKTTLELSDA